MTAITEIEFDLINEIGKDIISTLKINEIIKRIYSNVNELVDAQIFAISIYNESQNKMDIWGVKNHQEIAKLGYGLELDDKFWFSYCFNNQKEIMVNDYSPESYDKIFSNSIFINEGQIRQSFIYIPLTINEKPMGTLSVQTYRPNAYNKKHLKIVKSLASYIAVAIQNASNYQKIVDQNKEILSNSRKLAQAHANLEEKVVERTREVEKQKEKLQEVNRELERLSIVARQTENAIMIMDAVGNVLWVNDCFTKIYDYSYEEFIRVRGRNILETSFNPEIEKAVKTCIAKKETVIYEALNVTAEGNDIWTQTTLTPVLDYDGNIEHLVTIDTDITKRKLIEKEVLNQKERLEEQAIILQEANAKLKKLSIVAQQTENAIMIMDAVGNIQWVNEYFTKIYEYDFEKLKKVRGQNILQTSFNPDIKKALETCQVTKKAVFYEAPNLAASGKEIWTQTTLTPILNDDGDVEHLVAIDTDITKRKIAEAKVNLQNRNITDSIRYASRIQKAIMPSDEILESFFDEYFVYNKPKDIVSGDFYWAKKVDCNDIELIIVAVADCTGHGVPGAFVSMLGISFLNDIITSSCREGKPLLPNEILEKLRRRVKRTLNQTGSFNDTKDGMDLAICIIDYKNMKIQYSGANNPLYHAKVDIFGHVDLEVYKPTKNPIGIYYCEKQFEMQEFIFNQGDNLYLFSDGIIDQFGGPKDRKFMASNFKKMILENASKSMYSQEVAINTRMQNWMKKTEQVDDMLVLGIKL